MVDEQKISGSDVCVFEMTERVGGRLMSLRGFGPESDLTVDAGGYRTVRCIMLFEQTSFFFKQIKKRISHK
jgi:monoamine oxidase